MTEARLNLDLSSLPKISPPIVGHTIYHFRSVDSTNDLMKRMVRRGTATHGTVVVSDEQMSGRGRLGRAWEAAPGSGLLTSTFVEPFDPGLSYAVCSLAVSSAVHMVTDRLPEIKWPNDLLLDGLKIGGILVEAQGRGYIAGIGINSNMNSEELARIGQKATSLRVACGHIVDQSRLLGALLSCLEGEHERSRSFPEAVFRDWRDALVTLGRQVEVETSRERWVGQAVDVAPDGSLLVTNDKRIVHVYAADVRLRAV